jgi:hypothetical protein
MRTLFLTAAAVALAMALADVRVDAAGRGVGGTVSSTTLPSNPGSVDPSSSASGIFSTQSTTGGLLDSSGGVSMPTLQSNGSDDKVNIKGKILKLPF